MSGVSDLSQQEMRVLTKAIDLWERMLTLLGEIEAYPLNHKLHIATEMEPGYLGWIGYNEGGGVTFQPALKPEGVESDE